MRSVLWFRRDLRLADHPALAAAAGEGEVVPLFVVDPLLQRTSGPSRRAFLADCLRDLHDATDGALVVRTGDPVDAVQEVVAETGAERVHATADFGPYGSRRDEQLDVSLVGSPYAVAPGQIRRRSRSTAPTSERGGRSGSSPRSTRRTSAGRRRARSGCRRDPKMPHRRCHRAASGPPSATSTPSTSTRTSTGATSRPTTPRRACRPT